MNSKRIILVTIAAVIVVGFLFNTVDAFALDKKSRAINGVEFSDPDETTCASGGASSIAVGSGVASLEKSPTLEAIFKQLISHQPSKISAVQAAAIMGNMYAESGFNSDAHEVGNDIGYGLAQWSFGRRTNLENYAKEKGVATSDVTMQVDFLLNKEYEPRYKASLSGTDFNNATDIGKATEAWMLVFEVPAMKPANDPAALNSKRIPAALKIYDFYKDLAPSVSGAVARSNCSSDNGVVAGNVVQTALGLALTSPADGKTKKTDARDTYQAIKNQYSPTADWTDCGGFVATVMISSGVDKNYPKINTLAQREYVRSNTDKYQIIEKPTSTADLQPGDILITDGHTMIYTGNAPYNSVDASLNQRVPGVLRAESTTWMFQNDAIAARIIK